MLNEALRLVRVYHDINQSQLAKRLDISRSYLSEIESGKKTISINLLTKYADVFNIPPSSLLHLSEHIENNSLSKKARVKFAAKIVKMLKWLSDTESVRDGKFGQPA